MGVGPLSVSIPSRAIGDLIQALLPARSARLQAEQEDLPTISFDTSCHCGGELAHMSVAIIRGRRIRACRLCGEELL